MSDYKRWISYMYIYESNVKKNNVGYIRVEQRGSRARIAVHIKVMSISDSMKVYLYTRRDGIMKGIYVGDITMDKNASQQAYHLETEIPGEVVNISDTGGVIVYYSDDKYFGSEWDDVNISITDFRIDEPDNMETQTDKDAESDDTGESEIIQEDSDSSDLIATSLEGDMQDMSDYQDVPAAVAEEVFVPEEDVIPENMPVSEDTTPATEKVSASEEAPSQEDMPASEGMHGARIMSAQERTPLPENMPASEDMHGAQIMSVQERTPLPEDMPAPEGMHGARIVSASEKAPSPEGIFPPEAAPELRDTSLQKENDVSERMQRAEEKPEDYIRRNEIEEAAKKMLSSYPKMFPFENDDRIICVRIEPQDIGQLPIDTWILANNSFLLQGYYSYRHLMLMCTGDDVRPAYLIGVPGIYRGRDEYMAQMFGFGLFKPMRECNNLRGEFGYWCVSLTDIPESRKYR